MPPHRSEPVHSSMLAAKPYAKPEDASVGDGDALVQDQAGFPTYSQYKAAETGYVASLNLNRRAKALISQDMFYRVMDVLVHPQGTSENAQFRHWARKMFQLGRSSDYYAGQDIPVPHDSDMVLTHDGMPVAIQERLYSLLCHFHGMAGHGGRDRTYILIRQHYSWVPKELVLQFIRLCPICKSKGRRRIQSASFSPIVPQVLDSGTLSEPSSPAVPIFEPSSPAISIVEPLDSYKHIATAQTLFQPLATTETRSANVPTGLGLRTVPMSREVSLYQGLPNGWQYYTDYATAYKECIRMKKLQDRHPTTTGRPRIPSVVPFIPRRTMQNLINTYLQADSSIDCVDPTFLSSPLLDQQDYDESFSFSYEGKQDISNDNELPNLLYTHKNVDISELKLPSSRSTSPDYVIPDLVNELIDFNYDSEDSPAVTELPTPQDEELAGSRGLKFDLSQNADTESTLG